MAHRVVLVKVVAQTVTAVMDGDRVLGENEGPRIACYSQEELAGVWEKAEEELAQGNAELNPPRAKRRKAAAS